MTAAVVADLAHRWSRHRNLAAQAVRSLIGPVLSANFSTGTSMASSVGWFAPQGRRPVLPVKRHTLRGCRTGQGTERGEQVDGGDH